MGPQNRGSPNLGNFENLGTKQHLDVDPVARHREFYKGEGDGFPQVRVVMSLKSLCLPVAYPCTKSVLTTH